MGLAGPQFVAGTGALAFLMIAEVVAATAVVAESALVYVARHRNMMISLATIILQVALSFALILGMRAAGLPTAWQAVGPAMALPLALGFAAIVKARLLSRLLGQPVSPWRWALVWAAAAGGSVGHLATLIPEWSELVIGMPVVLLVYGAVIWRFGFTPADRILFRPRATRSATA